MEREMQCSYLEWQLNIEPEALKDYEARLKGLETIPYVLVIVSIEPWHPCIGRFRSSYASFRERM